MVNANSNSAGYFSVSISGGQELSSQDKMLEVFMETVKILDPSVTDEELLNDIDIVPTNRLFNVDHDFTVRKLT